MQNYYPAPPSLLVANPKLRQTSLQIDANTADILANKERELMQTSNRIDYYKDGLGTRAPLNSDNYNEKQIKLDQTSKIDEEMVCCFVYIFIRIHPLLYFNSFNKRYHILDVVLAYHNLLPQTSSCLIVSQSSSVR